MASADTLQKIYDIIAPFNKKNIELSPSTTFATDLNLDSLTVMDLVAEIEDEFDIVMPLNLLPNLDTIEDVTNTVEKIVAEGN